MRLENRISTAFLMVAALAGAARAQTAEEILAVTGVRGGLVVHLGCGDGTLTASLRINDRFLVHGLDGDAGNVGKARRLIRSKGAYGPVAVDRLGGASLPYADSLVNMVVAESAG
ncbi:MAG: class I SAM-dependent methyltransferase, partial [Phycisphaerae bacterium]